MCLSTVSSRKPKPTGTGWKVAHSKGLGDGGWNIDAKVVVAAEIKILA